MRLEQRLFPEVQAVLRQANTGTAPATRCSVDGWIGLSTAATLLPTNEPRALYPTFFPELAWIVMARFERCVLAVIAQQSEKGEEGRGLVTLATVHMRRQRVSGDTENCSPLAGERGVSSRSAKAKHCRNAGFGVAFTHRDDESIAMQAQPGPVVCPGLGRFDRAAVPPWPRQRPEVGFAEMAAHPSASLSRPATQSSPGWTSVSRRPASARAPCQR